MSQLDTLSPETKPGQVAGAVCCEGSRLEDPCSQPLFFQGHRLPCKLSGRLGLPSGESEGLRSNSGGVCQSAVPCGLGQKGAIISLGQWWEIDSLKHTVTGK